MAVDTTGDGTIDARHRRLERATAAATAWRSTPRATACPDTAIVGVLVDTDNDGQADVLLVDSRTTRLYRPARV